MTEDRLAAIRARLAAVNGRGLFPWHSAAELLHKDLPWLLEHVESLEKDLQDLVDDFAVVSPEEEREVERLQAECDRLRAERDRLCVVLECETLVLSQQKEAPEWNRVRRWLGLTSAEGAEWYRSVRERGRELVQRKQQQEKGK